MIRPPSRATFQTMIMAGRRLASTAIMGAMPIFRVRGAAATMGGGIVIDRSFPLSHEVAA